MVLDHELRTRYQELLTASLALPPEARPIAYDPDECEAIERVGPFVKRLEPRRVLKRKEGTPDDCEIVRPSAETVVQPEIDHDLFNFTKVRSEERLALLELADCPYHLVVNKYPAVRGHLLLAAEELRPQVLTLPDLYALREFLCRSSFLAFFNSWCAAATVNHFHFQLIDPPVPIEDFPLESAGQSRGRAVQRLRGHAAASLVFPAEAVEALWQEVRSLLESNQPHNLFFTRAHTYLFPRNPDPQEKGKELYGGEEPGALEYGGIFITYDRPTFESLTLPRIEELFRRTTGRMRET